MTASQEQTEFRVPFLDIGRTNARVKDAVLEDIEELIDSGQFTNGPQVAEFERSFAEYSGASDCVGVASGLDALRLGLIAAGLKQGDEVLVPANTFIATFEAVTQAGGTPVPVDVSTLDYNMDPGAADVAITPRTRFVLPVHLYGQMADMRALAVLAGRRDLVIIEDACQAHGSERDGLRAGACGAAGAFSFYPGKNLGAFGDAGALVTSNGAVASITRALREHGQQFGKYLHSLPGYTSRLDSIQAIVLKHKLKLLPEGNRDRGRAANYYSQHLSGLGEIRVPPQPEGSSPVWHLYPICLDDRDAVSEYLSGRGISTGLHYPLPPHLSEAYASLGYKRGAFPVTESLAHGVLSLPIYPGIREAELDHVVRYLAAFYNG